MQHKELWAGRDLHFSTQANVRAKKAGAIGRLNRQEVGAITGPCSYCGAEADEWDHVEPLTRGGPNDVFNIVPCCRPCNLSKNNRTLLEWLMMKQRHLRLFKMIADGLSVSEAARRIGISRDSAGSIVHLARRRQGALNG